jgi:hypothetical protein
MPYSWLDEMCDRDSGIVYSLRLRKPHESIVNLKVATGNPAIVHAVHDLDLKNWSKTNQDVHTAFVSILFYLLIFHPVLYSFTLVDQMSKSGKNDVADKQAKLAAYALEAQDGIALQVKNVSTFSECLILLQLTAYL